MSFSWSSLGALYAGKRLILGSTQGILKMISLLLYCCTIWATISIHIQLYVTNVWASCSFQFKLAIQEAYLWVQIRNNPSFPLFKDKPWILWIDNTLSYDHILKRRRVFRCKKLLLQKRKTISSFFIITAEVRFCHNSLWTINDTFVTPLKSSLTWWAAADVQGKPSSQSHWYSH